MNNMTIDITEPTMTTSIDIIHYAKSSFFRFVIQSVDNSEKMELTLILV
jgi:hypothetical protein